MQDIPPNDPRLVIRIENDKPIALDDFAQCLQAWESQFKSYIATTTDPIDSREAKLFVREIRKGSTIIDLVPIVPTVVGTVAILPLLQNANTVARFAGYVSKVIGSLLGRKDSKTPLPAISNTDLRDFEKIVQPIATGQATQMVVETLIQGDVHVHVTVDFPDANAVQNQARQRTTHPVPEATDGVKTRVILSWHQMNQSPKNTSTNLGYIDSIARGAKNVIFEDDSIKMTMVHDDPFNKFFVVDAEPLTTQGKIVAYRILRLHESLPKPPEDPELF